MAFFDEFKHLKVQLEEIKLATDNFADDKVIGNGGFGKVYKGEISHSKGKSMAAFKRLDSRVGQGNPEFWKEIMMLSRYAHENLVSLLGYCDEGGEKILVYEHASHGSLDCHLRSTTLTWIQRIKICLGAARGLSYLHDHKGTLQRVLHRDIKSANILLDENWNAKVSDLGLSKIGPANQQHTLLVTNVAGTPGYCDPLYMEMGFLTKESDVYSFGVVLFEVLCGKLCHGVRNGRWEILVPMWKHSYEQNKLDEIIFQDLKQHMDSSSLKTFSDIAYQCLQRSREERPPIARVVKQLEIALEVAAGSIGPSEIVKHDAFENDEVDMQDLEIHWEQKLPNDYEQIIKWSKDSLKWTTKKELYYAFSKGFLINKGEEWFSLARNGKKRFMVSAREVFKGNECILRSRPNSRFEVMDLVTAQGILIDYKIKSQLLSPQTTYACYLVYDISTYISVFEGPLKVTDFAFAVNDWRVDTFWFINLVDSQTPLDMPKMKGSRQLRNDGWMEVQVWEFRTSTNAEDIWMFFYLASPNDSLVFGLTLQGIELRPL